MDEFAGFGDDHDIFVGAHDEGTDEAAAFVDELADAHAEGATRLGRVFVDGGALGVAGFGDDQQVGVLARDLHAEEFIVAAEFHATHAGRGAAHGAQLLVGGGEAHGLAVAGDEDEVLVGHDGLRGDQFVGLAVFVLAQVDGDDAAGAGRVVQAQRGLLDEAALSGQDEVVGVLVGADREDLRDALVGLECQQVGDVLALGVAATFGDLVSLGAVDAAEVGEEQQPIVRGRDKEVFNHVVAAQLCAAHALAAALLGAVVVCAGALGEAVAGDGDDDVLFGDEVFHRHFPVEGEDTGAALVAELVDDVGQFGGDDGALALGLGEDVVEVVDAGLEFGVLVHDLLTLEGCQAAQLEGQDRVGLDGVHVE